MPVRVCGTGLLHWARASDENIHEPAGALLPARTGRDKGDSDERPKQIEGVEISADVTALDGAFHQRVYGSMDLP